MRRFRFIVVLFLSLCGICSWGQNGFNPPDPPDPGLPPMKLDIVVTPGEAGSVSGAGRYIAGTAVNLYAYVNTGFRFVNWTDSQGNVISTSTSFIYTKGEGNERLYANYEFSPNPPEEPAEPETILYYQLTLKATEGGTVSGGGRYLAGTQVTLSANPDSRFYFDGWYNPAGEKISSESTFQYTTTNRHLTLEGRFVFNPESPSDPSDMGSYYTVTATATEGGTVNFSSQRVREGESITLSAYNNTGYVFKGWYLNGEFYTNESCFSYTVTSKSRQDFEARFEFSPEDPSEPNASTKNSYGIYLPNEVAKPGDVVVFPVYVSNESTLTDISFQLIFDPELKPDLTTVKMSQQASGYKMSYQALDDVTYAFTFTGGQLSGGNAEFFNFQIPVPEDITTARGYPVKISQVSVKKADGTTQTASTRNGRVSVYKLGDSNGDDDIDVADLAGVACFMQDKPEDHLIFYVSDMDGNKRVEERDFDILVESILDIDYQQQHGARAKSVKKIAAANENSSKIELRDGAVINPATKLLTIPVHVINRNRITGLQFDIIVPKDVDVPTDENGDFVIELAPSRQGDHLLAIRSTGHGSIRVICSSKGNSLFAEGEDIIFITMKVKGDTDIDHLDVNLENIIMTDDHAFRYTSEDTQEEVLIKKQGDVGTLGDINGDGYLNAKDVTMLVNYLAGRLTINRAVADMNGDGKINVADVIKLINRIR